MKQWTLACVAVVVTLVGSPVSAAYFTIENTWPDGDFWAATTFQGRCHRLQTLRKRSAQVQASNSNAAISAVVASPGTAQIPDSRIDCVRRFDWFRDRPVARSNWCDWDSHAAAALTITGNAIIRWGGGMALAFAIGTIGMSIGRTLHPAPISTTANAPPNSSYAAPPSGNALPFAAAPPLNTAAYGARSLSCCVEVEVQ